jgi:intein-encoded DNA endonuclease-like protein
MENKITLDRIGTGHVCVEYLRERYIGLTMSTYFNGLSKNKVLEIYAEVMKLRKDKGYGQRKLQQLLHHQFDISLSESTISGWIHKNNIPFANEKTQFKPKPKPAKKTLENLYLLENKSASMIARKFKVSTIIVINWLSSYGINIRSHKESMNTNVIKQELSQKKLRRPIKEYAALSAEKSYVLGVLCGDAFINKKRLRLEIRKDTEFIAEFVRCLKEIYGLDHNIIYYVPKNTWKADISNALICADLLKYGKYSTFDWQIPPEIIKSRNKTIISSFLKGFYDSEGSVAKYTISTSSINKKGLLQIKELLSKLKINSQIYLDRKYCILVISRKSERRKFLELIGFTIQRKMEKLKEALK